MKQKPVFKNNTKGRIQVVQRGIPIWMNPGDIIVGESFRAFTKLGLEEVGRQGLPKPAPAPKVVVNDPEPEKSPVKVRELKVVDMMLPRDEISIKPGPSKEPDAVLELEDATVMTDELHPEVVEDSAPEPVDDVEEPVEEDEVEEEEDEEPVLAVELVGQGESLREEIIADIIGDLDDEPVVVMDEEEEVELEEPDDYPFKCEHDGCGRAFASKRGLKSHLRSHRE